ncbi:hypothetical protein [Nonomuraea bangladeshensis]|uniref:hypothetical protein n=1 Tax=Nonomuraea bangladeshensis TaxID=404385 RepID=UPI0031CDB646
MLDSLKFRSIIGLVALLFAVVGGIGIFQLVGPWSEYVDARRARLVLVNAFNLVNPGYTVDYFGIKDGDLEIHPRGGTVTIPVSARSSYLRTLNHQWHRFSVRMELYSDMKIEVPSLEATTTGMAIEAVSDDTPDATSSTSDYARKLLAITEEPFAVTAVVKLRAPQPEENVAHAWGIWDSRIGAVMLARPNDRAKPITWHGGTCDAMGFHCGPAEDLRTQQFQQWTNSLSEDDADALAAFGFNLQELRDSSVNPLISGFVITAAPKDIRGLEDDQRVQWIRITDVALDYSS